jgi:hypothetical protein
MSRKCVFVGDMHTGSRVGLWKKHTLEDDTVIGVNPAQEYLIRCWTKFWKQMEELTYDTVFLLGDLCDSNNRKEHGRMLSSVELGDQVEVAVELLTPHLRDKKVISVEGSRYHQSLDSSLDQRVCEKLSAICEIEHCGALGIGELTGTGRIFNVEHCRTNSIMYRAGGLDKDSWLLDAAENELGYYTDILVSGHLHWSTIMDLSTGNRDRWIIQAPGWKLWFPYKPGGYGKKIAQIGGCWAEVSHTNIQAQKFLFPYYKAHDKVRKW